MSELSRLSGVLIPAAADGGLRRIELPLTVAGLCELRDRRGPCAVVLDRAELARLGVLGDAVVDRGAKEPSQGLAGRLLGHFPGIPTIAADYRVPGRAVQGVGALLRAAGRRGEPNLFLVGLPGPTFRRLLARAASPAAPRSAEDPSAGWPRELLDLLPHRPVPAELVSTFVGSSSTAHLVRRLIVIGAEHDHPVLVLGDTGTGKEVVARSIHDQGARRHQRFVPVNCGAIPRELLESELFGALPGAYTGAPRGRRKRGLWEAAHLGTIFLDEVGDLPLAQQVKVLRTIDHGTIRPVGGDSELKVDARVVAATNRDLLAMVREGRFREDLYYRLRGFLVRTPALQSHPEDIPLLAQHFWRKITRERGGRLSAAILDELSRYRWPGNARELKSVLANLHVFFGDVPSLTVRHLRAVFELQGQRAAVSGEPSSWGRVARRRVEDDRRWRRVADALRALEAVMDPLLAAGPDSAASAAAAARIALAPVVGELELLAGEPRGGRRKDDRLAGALGEVRAAVRSVAEVLEDDAAEAIGRWRRRGRGAVDAARLALGEAP